MHSRSRESYFSFPIKKRPTRKSLNPQLEAWVLILALIVMMALGALALGSWWESLNTDQTIGCYPDHLSTCLVS